MKEKGNNDTMLSNGQFAAMVFLSPIVAVALFFAWPITLFVLCVVLIGFSIISYNKRQAKKKID